MSLIIILYMYLCFRAKQFICDFALQTPWMVANKGKNNLAGLKAISTHSGIHALGTLIICLIFAPLFWWLFIVDFFIHAAIDKSKSKALSHFNWKTQDSQFWWLFGLDQELHNLSHLAYIILIVSYTGF